MSRTHAFVICAYKESPYLEFCMRSLRKQTVRSDVYLVTSTPSEYIDRLAAKYRIPVFVRDGESSLCEDWLFGWRLAGAGHSLVTIAHQDDKYHPRYAEELLNAYETYPDMTVFCSDYVVLKTEEGRLDFADKDSIAEYAQTSVRILSKMGIMVGKGNNMFVPLANTTRAEVAVIVDRISALR